MKLDRSCSLALEQREAREVKQNLKLIWLRLLAQVRKS